MGIFRINLKRYMIRPIAYKTITKVLLVLVLGILWEEYINTNPDLTLVEYAFPILGIILITFSWFHYLALDGLTIHYLNDKKTEKKSKSRSNDIIDFTDEAIESCDELDKEEEITCKLISNVIAGLLYIFLWVAFKII